MVQQPDYIIDVRVGCVWRVALLPSGLAHELPRDEIHKVLATLLKRSDGRETVYNVLNQLVNDANLYLIELAKVFDEINSIYRYCFLFITKLAFALGFTHLETEQRKEISTASPSLVPRSVFFFQTKK